MRSVKTGEEQTLKVTGVLEAIGHEPRSELFSGQLPVDPAGYLPDESPSSGTAIEDVFACGDVVDHNLTAGRDGRRLRLRGCHRRGTLAGRRVRGRGARGARRGSNGWPLA